MRRSCALGIVIALLHAATGHAALGPRYGGELRVSVVASRIDLDPQVADDSSGRFITALVHESLLRRGPDSTLEPNLVQSWTPGPDSGEWTLTLATGLRFHDGSPVTMAAVMRSLRRFLRSGAPAAAALASRLDGGEAFRSGESSDLAGMERGEGRELRLHFRGATAPSDLLPLTSQAAAIVSEGGAGCGPFVPTVTAGGEGVFVAFSGHLRGRPYLDRVRIKLAANGHRAAVDWRVGRVQGTVGAVETRPPSRTSTPALLLLVLDPSSAAFSSATTRARVAQTIDRESLVRRLLPESEPWDRLLAERGAAPVIRPVSASGAPLRKTTIVLAVDQSLSPLVSQRILAHLASIGISARVVAADARAARHVTADARLLVFEPEQDEAALWLQEILTLVPGGGSEAATAVSEVDPAIRAEHAAEIEKRLLETGSLIPLAHLWRPATFAATVHDADAGRKPPLVEDAWLEP